MDANDNNNSRLVLNNWNYNNLIIQKLKKSNIKEIKDKNDKNERKTNDEIKVKNGIDLYNLCSNNNIEIYLKKDRVKEIFKKFDRIGTNFKFLLIGYINVLSVIIKIRRNCTMDDVYTQIIEIRQINEILRHNNFKNNFKNSNSFVKKEENKFYISTLNDYKKKGNEIIDKIDSLNNSVDNLKSKIKCYFSKCIREEINQSKIDNRNEEDNVKLAYDFDKKTLKAEVLMNNVDDLEIDNKKVINKNNSIDNNLNKNDLNYMDNFCEMNSIDNKNVINESNKINIESKKKLSELNLQHRRCKETISLNKNILIGNSDIEFSPAPKYHSRSRTINANIIYNKGLEESIKNIDIDLFNDNRELKLYKQNIKFVEK